MSITLKKFAATVISCLLLTVNFLAQNNNKADEPISDEYYAILEKKRELIGQEISTNKNEWSGVYEQGDHHPTVFMWSSTYGFLTWGSNHTFYPSRINFGKAEFLNGKLFITPEIGSAHLNFQSVPLELTPVKWGERHFLIPANELINFAYAVHSGAESQIVEYFAKIEDYEKPRTGLPNLPKEYEKILTMKAVKPTITAVKKDDENFWKTEVTLNLGRAGMLIKGMVFYYAKPLGGFKLMVTDLEEKSAKAMIVGHWEKGDGGENIQPKIGLLLSSKVPKDFDL